MNRATPPQWNTFTIRDSDWNGFDFGKITLKPIDYDYTVTSSGKSVGMPMSILIFITAFIWLCKYAIGKARNTRGPSETPLHPPSMIIITARTRNQTLEDEPPVLSDSSSVHVASGHSASSNGDTDKPPDYFTVMMADFAKGHGNFACTAPDSPPPKYEEVNGNEQQVL